MSQKIQLDLVSNMEAGNTFISNQNRMI